jgi:hypothetical protein
MAKKKHMSLNRKLNGQKKNQRMRLRQEKTLGSKSKKKLWP